jgi:hypothetical protein
VILQVHEYVSFLKEWEITPNQFLLVYILHLSELETASGRPIYGAEVDGKRNIMSSFFDYVEFNRNLGKEIQELIHGVWTSDDVQYLVMRNVLDSSIDIHKPNFADLIVTDKFRESLFALESEFQEFWDLYPPFVFMHKEGRNTRLPLKIVDKDSLEVDYMRKIVTKNQHWRLIKVLKWGMDKKLVNMRIDRFIKSEYWIDLEKEMNKDNEGDTPELSETVI